jgi:hypothetical protein
MQYNKVAALNLFPSQKPDDSGSFLGGDVSIYSVGLRKLIGGFLIPTSWGRVLTSEL